jgi:hypothetical protein
MFDKQSLILLGTGLMRLPHSRSIHGKAWKALIDLRRYRCRQSDRITKDVQVAVVRMTDDWSLPSTNTA